MPNGVIQRGVIISSLTINLALGDAVGAIMSSLSGSYKVLRALTLKRGKVIIWRDANPLKEGNA